VFPYAVKSLKQLLLLGLVHSNASVLNSSNKHHKVSMCRLTCLDANLDTALDLVEFAGVQKYVVQNLLVYFRIYFKAMLSNLIDNIGVSKHCLVDFKGDTFLEDVAAE